MSARLDTLRSMIEQDPKNSFLRYGLAMELLNTGQTEEAVTQFRTLIASDPHYAAAYFHGGRALEQLGRIDDARAIYAEGIAITARTGDDHTRGELEGAMALLAQGGPSSTIDQ
jgi:Flp pilus assembly protein TadD